VAVSNERNNESSDDKSEGDGKRTGRRMSGPRAAGRAAEELLELTGKNIEGIVGLERADGGWTVSVEVLEVRRIPNTTDVLALYEVDADEHGSLMGYRRMQRYLRGNPSRESDD
jgi:hypothetical protein